MFQADTIQRSSRCSRVVRACSSQLVYGAGLRRIRFHDIRHTSARLLIQNGKPLAYVRDQLGHSSRHLYTHWIPGSNREAMDRLPTAAGANPLPKMPGES